MVLANGRLSERSQRKGLRVRALMQPAVAVFSRVLAQSEADARRMQVFGPFRDGVLQVVGNLKFDVRPRPDLLARGRQWREQLQRSVVLAAITREGEEAVLLAEWKKLRAPRPLLVLVPRHPQRFDEVGTLIADSGLFGLRRSAWTERSPIEARAADVWLGDSVGEMPLYYALADIALLGGSFAPLGGHNLIEAAACGCPLLMGPSTFNFAQAADWALAAGAAERCDDLPHAVGRAVDLCGDAALVGWSQRALAFAAQHRGAASRTAQAVLDCLPPSKAEG
jgi:3-deoxy-D-manno-octulosonic-acid transferase